MNPVSEWQRVELSAVIPGPWRNGGGATRELVAWPDAAQWSWRMSVAEVAISGSFSGFPGVERWFAVLDGAGVALDVAGEVHRLTVESAPLRFDGGATTACTLLRGPTQDFNLMVRRDRVRASRMTRLAAALPSQPGEAAVVALYALAPSVLADGARRIVVAAGTLVWARLPAGTRPAIETSHALWMEIVA